MLAMALDAAHRRLTPVSLPDPVAGPGEVVISVHACGVCRTDLHVVDGDLGPGLAEVIPGHEIVGVVRSLGAGVDQLRVGDRVGVPWLGGTCGRCRYCREGAENLCDAPQFTGWTRHGGYAELTTARAEFCIPLPPDLSDIEAAPLLCAGLIGFRAWRMACEHRPVQRLGLYGFGAAAHLLVQLAIAEGQVVHALTHPGDNAAQLLARGLGCGWVGGSDAAAAESLDAAIIFAPVGDLVPAALRAVRKGGVVVCAGIHMSDIPSFPYAWLWNERRILSVANLTRADAREYLPRALAAGVHPQVTPYALSQANQAIEDLRNGAFTGAAVLLTGADQASTR